MLKNRIYAKRNNVLKIERLIIYTIVLLLIITLILQTSFPIIIIAPFIGIYFFVVILDLVIPFLQNKNLEIKDTMLWGNLPEGFENFKRISRKHYSFDNNMFYIINDYEQKVIAIPFSDIKEVSRTDVKINNRRFWKIVALYNNEEVAYKFRHNYTLWNNNFPSFLKQLKQVNPAVVISKWFFIG